MIITDFIKGQYSTFEAKTTIWNTENVEIYINFLDETNGNENEYLSIFITIINQKLKWINNNRQTIEQALLDDNMLSLAEDWTTSSEEAEDEEGECYIMEDGQKVFLPISPKDFFKSIHLDAINLYFDSEMKDTELYLSCNPDYFYGHSILVIMNSNNQFKSVHLAG